MLADAPASPAPQVITLIAATVAVIPPRESEVKKALAATARVKRLLAGAFAVSALLFAALHSAFSVFWLLQSNLLGSFATSLTGLALFLLAPLWLVAGNLILQPLESLLRRRYLRIKPRPFWNKSIRR